MPRTPPDIVCRQQHPSIAAPDIMAAVRYYTDKLGFKVGFTYGEPPTMAGVTLGDVQIFLKKGKPAPEGCELYFVVENVDELFAFHRDGGVEVAEKPGDREYGMRDYGIKDLNGYDLSFGQHIFTVGEPVEIQRVDVPVRLEKRLAAVLTDLAILKHMSVSSCLEETLLHTFEPLGDGVASPHTETQLRQIQDLKKKHGMEYDCHASYRFVEKP